MSHNGWGKVGIITSWELELSELLTASHAQVPSLYEKGVKNSHWFQEALLLALSISRTQLQASQTPNQGEVIQASEGLSSRTELTNTNPLMLPYSTWKLVTKLYILKRLGREGGADGPLETRSQRQALGHPRDSDSHWLWSLFWWD